MEKEQEEKGHEFIPESSESVPEVSLETPQEVSPLPSKPFQEVSLDTPQEVPPLPSKPFQEISLEAPQEVTPLVSEPVPEVSLDSPQEVPPLPFKPFQEISLEAPQEVTPLVSETVPEVSLETPQEIFPVPSEPVPEVSPESELPEEQPLPPSSQEKHVIMVVDDEDLIRDVVIEILTDVGYEVVGVGNGQLALSKIYTYSGWGPSGFPDLIISDVMMPQMDGFELCKRIKIHPDLKKIPFIFLTVKNDTLSRAQGFVLGCQRYIVKPFNRKGLIKAVNERLVDAAQTRALLAEHTQSLEEGEIAQIAVLSLVDLFLIGEWSGSLTVKGLAGEGRVEFKNGEVVAVRWGDLQAEKALSYILAQVEGTFRVEKTN